MENPQIVSANERTCSVGELGNTESSSTCEKTKKSNTQNIYWCFTYNNYEIEKIELLVSALENICDWFIFQEEIGEKGTKHLQGCMKLKKRDRLSKLKKIEGAIHWEVTKQITASMWYCSNKEKRSGKIWTKNCKIPIQVKVEEPYGWQKEVMKIINQDPDKRSIYWFYDEKGNKGKTTLCKYLVVKRDAIMLCGKSNDMYHMLSKNENPTLICVDVPRSSNEYINYGAIEQIKNGLIFSGKYEGKQLVFDAPHVFVFANEYPDVEKLSKDRWKIFNIDNMEWEAVIM